MFVKGFSQLENLSARTKKKPGKERLDGKLNFTE
jgi:hypothetical protein